MKLLDLLNESRLSSHYIDQKTARVPPWRCRALYPSVYGKYNAEQTNEMLVKYIGDYVTRVLTSLEYDTLGISNNRNVSKVIILPRLVNKDISSPIQIDGKTSQGYYYVLVASNDTLITVMLRKNMESNMIYPDTAAIKQATIDHFISNKIDFEGEIIVINNRDIHNIDIDELWGKKPKTIDKGVKGDDKPEWNEEDWNFRPRTDYRKEQDFTFKIIIGNTPLWKTKKIINTSSGSAGKGDANGHLDWVEVDDPHVSKGVMNKTRKIPNVKTKTYFA